MMPKVEPLPAPAAREGATDLSIAADSFETKHPAKKIQGHVPTRRRWPRPSPALTRRASAIHNLGPIPLAYLFAELAADENPQERIVAYAELSDLGLAVFIKLSMTPVLGNGRAS
jgi:hypothetical protein